MALYDLPFVRKTRKRSSHKRNAPKLVTNMRTSLKKRSDPVFGRKFVTWGVIISTVMVGVSVFVAVYFNAEAVAHRKFEQMAREYYEDYYLERFKSSISEEVFEQRMAIYEKTGLDAVPLRQLLLYQQEKNAKMRKYFEGKDFSCDKNTTTAKFYPIAPYGKTDYTVEFNYTCTTE